ncbi:hypothetical protein [Pedobacter sp. D749]|uniref:hypothetical protein n=1 Tax=Pedobacter sp. D749 TaxID=2856523 RepID=UPI001C589A88|nr:hypothetical protein [Pedobacter sp. D749]QXU42327.1 hypothetical protein KYH19_01620 [Pedobacter sp. D749]
MQKKIVLVTSGQPSLNPRLVKEADTLANCGYDVTVVYLYWNDWGTKFDSDLLRTKNWKAVCVGGNPQTKKWLYWKSRVKHRLANLIASLAGFKYMLGEYSISRGTSILISKTKKIKADLYIAHNLGAIPAAVAAANYNKAKCGFDAEDLHRFEMSNDKTNYDVRLKAFLEEKYFTKTNYITTSSQTIANQYKIFFPHLKFKTILNTFPKQLLSLPNSLNSPLKLFWFSQTIGISRGIQDIFRAIKILEEQEIELHLLGKINNQTKLDFDRLINSLKFDKRPKIFFHAPLPPHCLFAFANQFHIGLCLEPAFSKNNDLALSNKIFTYIQAGLAIIASDTSGQKWLLENYPEMGSIYKRNNPNQLAILIQNYLSNPKLLKMHQAQALEYANHQLNWEQEEQKFIKIITDTIGE